MAEPRAHSRTPSISDSPMADDEPPAAGTQIDVQSRPPTPPQRPQTYDKSEESVSCEWGDDCGVPFTDLQALVDHIHNDHIGMHKSSYSCEWASCPRRGLPQTSRFALVSHIRSHTGEKPFICALPQCDKSFTRSDALAKHMRQQHNISPPLPGRGGSRKRKRGGDEASESAAGGMHASTSNANSSSFNTFKVEPTNPSESPMDEPYLPREYGNPRTGYNNYGLNRDVSSSRMNGKRGRSQSPGYDHGGGGYAENDEGVMSDSEDTLPAHLLPHYDAETGLVLGRTPAMVMYLLMKAKHRHAMQQHEELLEQLRVIKAETKREKELKEQALDKFLRRHFGEEAEKLIPQPPPFYGHTNHSGHHHRDHHRQEVNLPMPPPTSPSSIPIMNGYPRV